MSNYEVLENEMKNVKEDIVELKNDSREDRKAFTKAIERLDDSLHDIRENGVKLNAILENQNQKLGYLSKKVDTIEQDIKDKPLEEERKWYREILTNSNKHMIYLILILLSLAFGAKLEAWTGLFK